MFFVLQFAADVKKDFKEELKAIQEGMENMKSEVNPLKSTHQTGEEHHQIQVTLFPLFLLFTFFSF